MQQYLGDGSRVPTLAEVWTEYARVRNIKYSTLKNYQLNLYAHLHDWLNRPIDSFTKSQVIERHRSITHSHGPSAANTTLRVFRAICNYAMAVVEDRHVRPIMTRNPASVLKEAMIWNRQKESIRHLSPSEFPAWWESVQKIENKTTTDFLLFLLFTGCRKGEALSLKWENVSLADHFVLFPTTKNGLSHKLPVCSQVMEMLVRRRKLYGGYYVFSQATNPLKPYDYKHYTTKKISTDSGLVISPHDLRRTYATVCSTLRFDILLIKRLLNHANRDVTSRYIIKNLEPFRPEIQKAGDAIEMLLAGNFHFGPPLPLIE